MLFLLLFHINNFYLILFIYLFILSKFILLIQRPNAFSIY